MMAENIHIRKATPADIPCLREVIDASVRGLQARDYSPSQIDGALRSVYGVDSQLIADGTYFVGVVETQSARPIVACGAGASAKLYTAEINMPHARIHCSILPEMRQRFALSLCIRSGRGAALAA